MSVWVGSGCAGVLRSNMFNAPPVTTAAAFMSTDSMESGIEAGVVPTVTGSLASPRDSLGSLSRAAEPMYDTDHTDLGSELDEAEIRRELMHDKWRILFDRFDPEGFGEIPWPDFLQTLKHPDFIAQVPPHKLEILLDKAQCATSNAITFQEFVNVMTPDLNAFQRNYISEVRRFIELERKLRYMRTEMKKYDVYVPELLKEPPAMSPHDLNMYESTLEKSEHDIGEMDANQVRLMKNYEELTELQYVLSTIEPILGNVELRGDAIFSKTPQGVGDVAFAGRLTVTTGVVPRPKCYALEMMLWRISRGNIYFRTANEDKVFQDPFTGTSVRKVAFIAVCQGEALSARMEKVCTGFRANIYPCPNTAYERITMIRKLNAIIQDLGQVLKKTKYHRCKALRAVGKQWPTWSMQVKKAKAVYHTMNLLSLDFTSKCLIGQCWVSKQDLPKVQETLRQYSAVGANVQSFLSRRTTADTPPTYHRTNKFTYGFQALILAYGDSTYREINPGLYTIITFPFLFAVMFGDFGHGLIMLSFALWMLIKEKKFMEERSTNEIWNIFFGGRYIILLMSLFTLYTGFVYNDIFSKPMVLWQPYWKNQFRYMELKSNEYLSLDPMGEVNNPYPFGIDPTWTLSTNKIMHDNSIKMKLSIILGVTHMMFGLFISLFNHLYFRRYYAIFLEFIPQVLFLTCLFMWLVVMIFWKWFQYGAKKKDIKLQPGCAPLILILFIDMALMRTTSVPDPNCAAYMFDQQEFIQKCLLLIGLASVPVLLFGTPLYKLRAAKKAKAAAKRNKNLEARLASGDSFGELMIHQGVHTIEFVLSTISHTASYLRLWALSLAHAQLSEMLWEMILSKIGLQNRSNSGFAMLFVIFAIWAAFTLSILVVMEGLSAFLHTLRLHWVEFMSKFYTGGGYMFSPFSFQDVLYGEEEKKNE